MESGHHPYETITLPPGTNVDEKGSLECVSTWLVRIVGFCVGILIGSMLLYCVAFMQASPIWCEFKHDDDALLPDTQINISIPPAYALLIPKKPQVSGTIICDNREFSLENFMIHSETLAHMLNVRGEYNNEHLHVVRLGILLDGEIIFSRLATIRKELQCYVNNHGEPVSLDPVFTGAQWAILLAMGACCLGLFVVFVRSLRGIESS